MLSFLEPLLKMNKRQLAVQWMNLFLILSSALMIWKGLNIVTNSESPIVVVLSGSMEPSFYRGDLLFLTMTDEPVRVGDICVFKIKGRDIPIVHRVLQVHDEERVQRRPKDGKDTKDVQVTQHILTKGDNNMVDDRGLYNPGQYWIQRDEIVGRVKGHLPFVGMVTILMNDYPWAKYILLAVLGVFVLITKE